MISSEWTDWQPVQTVPEPQTGDVFSDWVTVSVTMPSDADFVPVALNFTFQDMKPLLSWPDSGHDEYYVFRRTPQTALPFVPVAEEALVTTTGLSFHDLSAEPKKKYDYQVFGYGAT